MHSRFPGDPQDENLNGGLHTTTTCSNIEIDMCITIDMSGSVEALPGGSYNCAWYSQQYGSTMDAVKDYCPNYGQEVSFIYQIMEAFSSELASGHAPPSCCR